MRKAFPDIKDDGWRIPDWLWEHIQTLLPAPKPHPWGVHNPRVPDRSAMSIRSPGLHAGTGGCDSFRGAELQFGASTVRGMDGGRGFRGVMAGWAACV